MPPCVDPNLNSITASYGFDLENTIANQPVVVSGGKRKKSKKGKKSKKRRKTQKMKNETKNNKSKTRKKENGPEEEI